nr:hypothetical protein [Tanacetum cinerariifolium]
LWDVFAISTYFTVSLVFWYTGLVPDFATIRDRAKGKIAKVSYSLLSMGWTGSAKHWSRYETVSLILAGVSTPLVLSVEYEQYCFINRATGPYWWAYASMMTCNVITPQLVWFRRVRYSILLTFILSIIVNI